MGSTPTGGSMNYYTSRRFLVVIAFPQFALTDEQKHVLSTEFRTQKPGCYWTFRKMTVEIGASLDESAGLIDKVLAAFVKAEAPATFQITEDIEVYESDGLA